MKRLTEAEKSLLSKLFDEFLANGQTEGKYNFGNFLLEHPKAGLCFAVRVRKSLPERVQHLFYKDTFDTRLDRSLTALL